MAFVDDMLAKYQALLLANPGVTSVVVDGVSVSYADLEAKVEYWSGKVDASNGLRHGAATIKLGGLNA